MPPPPLYLYFSFYYTILRKFCQPLFSLTSCISCPYIYISHFIIPQIIVFVNMVVSCGIFSNKNANLLLKIPFYYTINHSFYQYSCSFKANLQLKPPFCKQNTHLSYTILSFFNNFSQFLNIFIDILLTFSQ